MNTMSSKSLKVYPQKWLEKNYDFVVWYDNKFSVNVKDTLKVVKNWNKKPHALMLHRHPYFRNVAREFEESMHTERYLCQKESYIKYINECKNIGLTDTYNFHSQCGFIIYNLNHNLTQEIQDTWMEHIKKCGIQDQISFNMMRQNYEDSIGEYKYPIKSSDQH